MTDTLYEIFKRSTGVSTDTRQNLKGKLFFALKGDRFDGNEYAKQAVSDGALASVVSDPTLKSHKDCFYVDNTLTSLQRLAHYHRIQNEIPVIALTGSNGKTTTKELLHSILAQKFQVVATKGNCNNHIGVPLTLLNLHEATEVAIIEMGSNAPGEIAWLTNITAPTMGLVTNVGQAHLEGFGTVENIWEEKTALLRYLDARALPVFINAEEESLQALKSIKFNRAVYYERNKLCDPVERVDFAIEDTGIRVEITGKDERQRICHSALYGAHNVHNILTGIAVGTFMGLEVSDILKGIENYKPGALRSEIVKRGRCTFYLDTYNANPTSMKRALDFFSTIDSDQKVVILGDMKEMGTQSESAHREILYKAARLFGESQIILVGPEFEKALQRSKTLSDVVSLATASDATTYLKEKELDEAAVLVKGSRSMKLEEILDGY